ncbi:glycosyltransferase [Hydrogenophaga sp. MI9]|uniref:glycosyltransferase n=1 Tax=Hydrogenophaga sp. MI9 TaxID=3453719 RepID=UPI003EEFA8E5
MKVLFCSTGGLGHLLPMRPLAAALQARGHRLAWVTAPDALRWLDGLDMALFPAGPAFGPGRLAFRQRHADALQVTGEALSAQVFPRLFGATLAPAMFDALGDAVDRWRPDLVVLEPAALAAPLVCAQRGLPWLTHEYGLPVPPAYLQDAMRWFGPWWQRAGLPVPDDGGLYRHRSIHVAPPGLSPVPPARAAASLALNPCVLPAGHRFRAPRPAGQPARVYLTFGTVFHRSPALLQAARALADTGAQVVVSVGPDGRPEEVPAHPNVQAATFVDQSAVLKACDLVVSHGGAGTVLAAAAHGLPQLVLPQGADHFRNARALAQAAVARTIAPPAQTTDHIREAAENLLSDPAWAGAARRLAEEMRAMPPPATVAEGLERWCTHRSPAGPEARPGLSAEETPASTPAAHSAAR